MNMTAIGTLRVCQIPALSTTCPPRKITHRIATVISVATFVLVGFSQVLLALLLLQVADDEDESVVLDEDRPSTRLGSMFQALLTISSSEMAATLLPIGTRGPMAAWPSRRAIISSMLTSQENPPLASTRIVDWLTGSMSVLSVCDARIPRISTVLGKTTEGSRIHELRGSVVGFVRLMARRQQGRSDGMVS